MTSITRTTDAKARIVLPKQFANATVILDQVSDNEVRIRKARVIPEDEVVFREEIPIILSDRDRDRFLAALDNPPEPNAAIRELLAGSSIPARKNRKRRHG